MFKSAAVEEESEKSDEERSIEKVAEREEEEGLKEVLKVEEDNREDPSNESFSSEAPRYARFEKEVNDLIYSCIYPSHSNDVSTDLPEYCNINVNANNVASGPVVQIISSSSDEVSTTEDDPKSKAGLPQPPAPPQRKSSISSTSVTSSSPDLNSLRPKEKDPASLGAASIPGIPTPGKV